MTVPRPTLTTVTSGLTLANTSALTALALTAMEESGSREHCFWPLRRPGVSSDAVELPDLVEPGQEGSAQFDGSAAEQVKRCSM